MAGLMTVFGVEDGRLTPACGQMFYPNARISTGLPTSNIAPSGKPIAQKVSFFIRSFLAKSTFFLRQL